MAEKANQSSLNHSRRDFIKTGAIATAGLMIVPRHVLGGKGYIAPSDRLLIAAVGAGGKGADDINHFSQIPNAEIAFLCDVDDRSSAKTRAKFPNAKYYKDWREMMDKDHKHFDAVSVSIPDHNHAIVALSAMQLGKHVYVQKPMTHDLYEARTLTEAAKKYKVVTQMGNQGASGDGVRQLREWYDAGIIGDVQTVYCWTDRPVWPQGIVRPAVAPPIPKELDWDLWLGTAPNKNYFDDLVPFNWRGWWDYGTGALGDMGCHLLEAPFRVLDLQYVKDVQSSVSTIYKQDWDVVRTPDSFPVSSHITLTFPKTGKTRGDVTVHWMDGGIQPTRPEELGANEDFGDGSGMLFIGTKGKMMASTYAQNPQLLPTSRTKEVNVPKTYARVPGGEDGHYTQWVEAAINNTPDILSSPFKLAGPLTEALLMANLSLRAHDVQKPTPDGKDVYYPGGALKLLWDNDAMRVTNFDDVNQFVKREYRQGWKVLG